jgi:tRNA (uracil-5-)-methyltransferase
LEDSNTVFLSTKVCGIEIDPASIAYANHNATINSIDNVAFHSGASETLFDAVTKDLKWAGDKTTLIVDPPRKGCDAGFLKQVVAFLPRRVVYVSCNVHTSKPSCHSGWKCALISSFN